MRRSLLVPAILVLVSCGGDGGAPDRRTIVDSRDNYDPRSLDPALSTDVPTGRSTRTFLRSSRRSIRSRGS
jgi:hypothetical protein